MREIASRCNPRQHILNKEECDICLVVRDENGLYSKHGSKAGHDKHIRMGQPPCEPCKIAYKQYMIDRRVPEEISDEEIRRRSLIIWENYLVHYQITNENATFNFDSSNKDKKPISK